MQHDARGSFPRNLSSCTATRKYHSGGHNANGGASLWVSRRHLGRHANGALQVRRLVPHRSLPPCGGGTGRGVAADSMPADACPQILALGLANTPLPNPPPQGGREHTEFAAVSSRHLKKLAQLHRVTGHTP